MFEAWLHLLFYPPEIIVIIITTTTITTVNGNRGMEVGQLLITFTIYV